MGKLRMIVFSFCLAGAAAFGEARLASVFSDHMVLQREKTVPVWGRAEPGEKITVEFAGQKKDTVADAGGKWSVVLDPMPASSSPRELVVQSAVGNQRSAINDVLVGDVWLCGGQSNMQFGLKNCLEGESLVQGAGHSGLRLFRIKGAVAGLPQDDVSARWEVSKPETASSFSAVGFLFGQRIHAETGIPVGLLQCAEGSTSVECWVSKETLDGKLFSPAVKKWREVEASWNDPAVRVKHIHTSVKDPDGILPSDARTYPAGCYNAMLHPLFPFALKGVLWYQGEANRERGCQYRQLLPAMIKEWRARFAQNNLPFYIVQLPEIGKKVDSSGADSPVAELREAQWLTTRNDPLMEMAVIIDTDPQGNLHPKNKQLPGDRLARIALAKDYGKEIEYSGPLFVGMEIKGGKALLSFDHIGGGLVVARRKNPASVEIEPVDAPLANFAVSGADRNFFAATAVIEGDTVVVGSESVAKPVAVRYAWAENPAGCNFYNRSGLPAVPFRTDDWPCASRNQMDGQVLIIRP